METDIHHFSASQHDMFMYRCQEQWRRIYIDGQRVAPGIALLTGRSVHSASEENFKQKRKSGRDESLSFMQEVAADTYDKNLKKDGVFIPYEKLPSAQSSISAGKEMAIKLVVPMAEEYCPSIQPVHLEKRSIIKVEDLPPIEGYLDVCATNDHLSEMKTAVKKWTQKKVDVATQPTLYREMYRQEFGKYPKRYTIDQFIKTKTPKYQCAETTRTADDFGSLINRFHLMAKQIDLGNFLPADPEGWCCSPNFCGFYWTCKFIPPYRRLLPKRSQ